MGADIRMWIQVDADGRWWTHVNAGGQKWMKVDLGGCRWMQMDKIGCMWMKVDAGGPEYDVRVQRIPGTGFFSFLLVVSEPVLEKNGTGQSPATGIRKN